MGIKRYVKILWMYSIGISLIFLGFYMIQFMSMGPPGFGLMMPGLLFCTIGGFYGKKKLLEEAQPRLMETRQMDQIKQNVVNQLKLPGTEQSIGPEGGEHGMAESGAHNLQPSRPMETQKARPAEKMPAGEMNRVLVCPGCDSENPPANMFCSKCGKRLRANPKAKKARKRSKT
jgi:hypothetical protein